MYGVNHTPFLLGEITMKKIVSLLLTASLIFLCSCSDTNDDITDNTSSAEVTESTTHPDAFSEWGTDLLPENFPAPPEGAHSLSIETGKASTEGQGYRSDWVSLNFTCLEKYYLDFAAEFFKAGYNGRTKYLSTTGYFPEGYNGSWQDGKTLVRLSKAVLNNDGEFEFRLDVMKCVDNFPSALEEYFPKFNGYSRNAGKYLGYNGIDSVVTEKFIGFDQSEHWYWDFGFENAFVGVTAEEFENYIDLLIDEGFSGRVSDTTADDCTVTSADLFKEISSDEVYGCFMLYNRSLQTLDIVYTNHVERYVGELVRS